MFCGKCGNQVKEGNTFCTVCGAKVGIEDMNTPIPSSQRISVNLELRKLVDNFLDLCDTIQGSGLWAENSKLSMKECCRFEFLRYLAYLGASDGSISRQESQFLNDYLDINLSASEIADFIKENNIFNEEFEQTTPVTLIYMVAADNKLIQVKGRGNEDEKLASECFFTIYQELGKSFIVCDNECDDKGIRNYTNYCSMLQNYIKQNLHK